MKKKTNKYEKHLVSIIRKEAKKSLRRANARKKKKIKFERRQRKFKQYYIVKNYRNDFYKSFYSKKYKGKPKNFEVSSEIGIEQSDNIDHFLEMSSKLIDSDSRHLRLDLTNCSYMWPSGITMLCSLVEWVELSAKGHKPAIASSTPLDKKVSAYLNYSGFYDYVNRPKDFVETSYSNHTEIVKIKREENYSNIEKREDEIKDLLAQYSCLDNDEIELFVDKILIEIFNNVTEHGIAHKDKGFWVIAQYHKTHKLISICIADNGIGIRNSLMTGPQKDIISQRISDKSENDGEFIKLTFEEYFSGALKAHIPTKKGLFSTGFESGANRGNGMKRIKSACEKLSVPFSILSQHGYLFIDSEGNIGKCGSKENRVFAGTLFNLLVRTKEGINEQN